MSKTFRACVSGLGMMTLAAAAHAETCFAPQTPDLDVDGANLSVAEYQSLTASMEAYDTARADYVACLNDVVLRKVEASDAAIDAARAQRGALYTKDPVTGDYTDPVGDRYREITQAFFDNQQARATAEAAERTRASEAAMAAELADTSNTRTE